MDRTHAQACMQHSGKDTVVQALSSSLSMAGRQFAVWPVLVCLRSSFVEVCSTKIMLAKAAAFVHALLQRSPRAWLLLIFML